MLLGHYGVAFAAKTQSPRTPLWLLVLAATFLDLLWTTFLVLDIEKVEIVDGITKITPFNFIYYPFSHSLLAVVMWAIIFAFVYFAVTRYKQEALVLGALVVSHWFLDFLVHRPDLPLNFNKEYFFGLGLWNFPLITIILEFGLLFAGLIMYLKTTTSTDTVGVYALYALVGFLSVIYLLNIFGPPPPNVKFISYAGHASWLFVLWSAWIDRHRVV